MELGAPAGKRGLTDGQKWWREKRLPEVEETAYALIRRHEAKRRPIRGCVVKPEILLPDLDLRLCYFSDDERAAHGVPEDAIGALKPFQRLVLIHDSIRVPGREGQTIGEEMMHFMLHAKGVAAPRQRCLDLELAGSDGHPTLFFCRSDGAAFVNGQRELPWMTREAAFGSACLQMPRDRYGPVAESELRGMVRHHWRSGRPPALMARVRAARPYVPIVTDQCLSAEMCTVLIGGVFESDLVGCALRLLHGRHQGAVSNEAQRRRFVELGLVHDASDLLVDANGKRLLPRFEFFFVADRIVEAAFAAGKE